MDHIHSWRSIVESIVTLDRLRIKRATYERNVFIPPMESLVDEFVNAYADLKFAKYIAVAAITLCIYDWMAVLDDEIEYVAKAKRSMGRSLYYFGRIWTLLGLALSLFNLSEFRSPLPQSFCLAFLGINTCSCLISLFSSYWLLTIRVVVMYRAQRFLVWTIYVWFFGTYLGSLGILIHAIVQMAPTIVYSESLGVCALPSIPSTVQAIFEIPLALELLLFTLISYRALLDYRSQISIHIPLLRMMYRDGIVSFIILFSVRIWNIVVFASQPASKMYEGMYIMWTLVTVLVSRIYLNIVRETRRNEAHQASLSHYQSRGNVNSDGQDISLIESQVVLSAIHTSSVVLDIS